MSFKFLCRILIKIKFKSKFWPDFERGNIWKEQELEMEVKLSIKIHRWIFLININNKNKYPVPKRKKKEICKKELKPDSTKGQPNQTVCPFPSLQNVKSSKNDLKGITEIYMGQEESKLLCSWIISKASSS